MRYGSRLFCNMLWGTRPKNNKNVNPYHPLGKKLQLAMEGRSDIDVDNGARREGLASASDFARPLVRRRPSRDDLRSQFEALVSNRVLECGWLCAPRQVQNSHCQATGSRFFFEARPAHVRAMAGLVFAIGLASESRLRSPAWLRECV